MKQQRRDLIFPLVDDVHNFGYNVYLENEAIDKPTIDFRFINSFQEIFPQEYASKKLEMMVGENTYHEISYEKLLTTGMISKLNVYENEEPIICPLNFMVFKISKKTANSTTADPAISLSFDSVLQLKGSIEMQRLKAYAQMVRRLKVSTGEYFFVPFLNVCQSSGSGKSKIAMELMYELPSCYLVLREPDRTARAFPFMSKIAEQLLCVPFQKSDDVQKDDEDASISTVGHYLLLLKALLNDYSKALGTLLKTKNYKSALKILAKSFKDGTFMGAEFDLFIKTKDWTRMSIINHQFVEKQSLNYQTIKVNDVISSCVAHLNDISNLVKTKSGHEQMDDTFILIIDEASLLSSQLSDMGISRFRLFRRAINKLRTQNNLVVITLGTNSDILDLNPELTIDSYRESTAGKLFPPFILSRNWDIFVDYEKLKEKPIGYNEILNGRLILFWLSLGRPVWGSISFRTVLDFIKKKITNNSLETGEAYLAFWMIRVGLSVHPAHLVTQHLVKSLMATILYISSDFKHMRVYYPSEPALAIGARLMLTDKQEINKYYSALEKFIKLRAIDTGRYSEIISGDICLLAVRKAAEAESIVSNWEYVESLPEVCKADKYILQNSLPSDIEAAPESLQIPECEGSAFENLFKESYIVVTIENLVKSKYGADNFEMIKTYIPKLINTAISNLTHYAQISVNFPFENLEPVTGDLGMTVIPQASSNRYKGEQLCNQVTAEILETLIIRGSGMMLAPRTFGLDHVIPVCLKPSNNTSKPVYSYIGTQVKRGKFDDIRKVMAKGAVSNHYVRCGLHGNKCPIDCELGLSDETFKNILGNGLMFVHFMGGDADLISQDFDSDREVDNSLKQLRLSGPEIIDEINEPADSDREVDNAEKARTSSLKRPRLSGPEIIVEIKEPESNNVVSQLLNLKKLFKDKKIKEQQFVEDTELCRRKLKENIEKICPEEYFCQFDNFKFQRFNSNIYEDSRFAPDLYLSIKVKDSLRIHCMVKVRDDGITEKLVAIASEGLEVFNNVLPNEARDIARKIIFNDESVFDEVPSTKVMDQKPSYKYSETAAGIVFRNNGSMIPIANNFIRAKYGLNPIPDLVPDYKKVTKENLYKLL